MVAGGRRRFIEQQQEKAVPLSLGGRTSHFSSNVTSTTSTPQYMDEVMRKLNGSVVEYGDSKVGYDG